MPAIAPPQRCRVEGAPLACHLRCWSCRRLVGPGHPIERVTALGMCSDCRRGLDQLMALGEVSTERLLSLQEAAAVLKVTPRTVQRLVRLGKLKPVKVAGRPRFRRVDVADAGDPR